MKLLNTDKLNINRPSFDEVTNAYVPLEILVPIYSEDCALKIGDKINEGDLISKDQNVNVHSSIPGIIKDFKKVYLPNGKLSKVCVIKMEGEFSFEGKKLVKSDWSLFSSSKIISLLEENGVHNSFFGYEGISSILTDVDLSNENNTLGVRLFDYDPSCITDSFLVKKYTEKVFEGAFILAKAINATNVLFFYSNEQKEYIKEFESFTVPEGVSFSMLQVHPQKYCFGTIQEINSFIKKKNLFVNSVVDSVTCHSSYEAIVYCRPVVDVFVQVSGSLLGEEKFFKVKRGTPIKNLIEECGFCKTTPHKIVINGLLKGTSIQDSNTPITDYVKSISILSLKDIPSQKQVACINCGDCYRICPEKIRPEILYKNYHFNTEIAPEVKRIAKNCTQCGRCNVVCPSRLPLYQTISLICKEDQ